MFYTNASRKTIAVIVALTAGCFLATAQAPLNTQAAGTSYRSTLPAGVKIMNDEDAYTLYSVYNDDKAIYVKLFITDSLQKRKILQNGIELWVDAKGKRNKVTGILFPLSVRGNNYPGGGNRDAAGGPPSFSQNNTSKKNTDTSIAELIVKRQEAELKGFGDAAVNVRQNIAALPGGISAGMYLAGDTLIYGVVLPFNILGNDVLAAKTVSIGIIEKGVDLPGFGEMGGGGPGGEIGGGGEGGPPPGPPPGDMQGGGADIARLFDANIIWYKLKVHN